MNLTLKPNLQMSPLNLVAVFVQNTPGQTSRLTRLLAEAGINIFWVTIASNGSFGVMKVLVDKPEAAMEALKRERLMVSLLEVVAVETVNQPGALYRVAECLGQNNINLDNCSGFVANNHAILLIEVHEPARAQSLLGKAGFNLLRQEALVKL